MKSFDDFYNESSEKLSDLLSEILSEEFPSGTSSSPAELVEKVIHISRVITLDTLREYHDWLSKQLGE